MEYQKDTAAAAGKIQNIVDNVDISIEDCMTKIESVNNKIKFTSFGKTSKTTVKKKRHALTVVG